MFRKLVNAALVATALTLAGGAQAFEPVIATTQNDAGGKIELMMVPCPANVRADAYVVRGIRPGREDLFGCWHDDGAGSLHVYWILHDGTHSVTFLTSSFTLTAYGQRLTAGKPASY